MRLALRDIWAAPSGAPEPALRGVSLEVGAGEWIAVRGPNGCGKSTLLLVAAGLVAPWRGIRDLGETRSGKAGAGPARIATVLQDPSVQFFTPSVAEEIELTALDLGDPPEERRDRAAKWIRRLGLGDELDRDPRTLSAGRQQLVLLAAALASAPALLVADEPGAHLDESSRERVIAALREETAAGLGILWATQSPAECRAATRVVSIESGMARDAPALEPGAALPPPARPESADAEAPGELVSVAVGPEPAGTFEGPRVRVAVGASWSLPSRGIVGFVGANGVGKSVVLGAVCGVTRTPQVQIRWADASGPPPLLVGQYPERQLFEETVGPEATFAAVARGMPRGEADARARELIDRFGLAGRLGPRRPSWELSTGEKRILLLIGALIAPARLIALDEPTAGLDPARSALLAGEIRRRSGDSLVVLASQDTAWLRGLGGRILPIPAL